MYARAAANAAHGGKFTIRTATIETTRWTTLSSTAAIAITRRTTNPSRRGGPNGASIWTPCNDSSADNTLPCMMMGRNRSPVLDRLIAYVVVTRTLLGGQYIEEESYNNKVWAARLDRNVTNELISGQVGGVARYLASDQSVYLCARLRCGALPHWFHCKRRGRPERADYWQRTDGPR